MNIIGPITPETVSDALQAHAGLMIHPEKIRLEWRSWRWIGYLPDDLLVFVSDSTVAANRLAREGKLLEILASRVSFGVPILQYVNDELGFQIRGMVPGSQIAGGGERIFADLTQGRRLAEELGRALAELHGAVSNVEANELGFSDMQLLPSGDELRRRLDGALPDPIFAVALDKVLKLYEECKPLEADIVLTHGDVWAGNLAVDLDTGALNGLFDFDDTSLADRHLDLRYIHSFGQEFAERALDAYAQKSGRPILWQRTAIYHAISAFTALAEALEKGEGDLLNRRLGWVSTVCRGPIAAELL